jgi:hypothetical protein
VSGFPDGTDTLTFVAKVQSESSGTEEVRLWDRVELSTDYREYRYPNVFPGVGHERLIVDAWVSGSDDAPCDPNTLQATVTIGRTATGVPTTSFSVALNPSVFPSDSLVCPEGTPYPGPWTGDVNFDGCTDGEDLEIICGQMGEPGDQLQGDANGDDVVNFLDYSVFEQAQSRTMCDAMP